MKNKCKFIVKIILCTFSFISISSMEKPQERNPIVQSKYLNMVFIFDEGFDAELKKNMYLLPEFFSLTSGTTGPMFRALLEGIKQEIPILVSSVLIRFIQEIQKERPFYEFFLKTSQDNISNIPFEYPLHLVEGYHELKNQYKSATEVLQKNYQSFNDETKSCVLLLPNELLRKETLDSLGFNVNNLKPLKDILFSDLPLSSPINIETFKKIFNQSSQYRKRIILMGHGDSALAGGSKSLIAQMEIKQYLAFLESINSFCDFLFIISCYSGGINMIEAQKEQLKINDNVFSHAKLNYPIILGSTIDAPTTINILNYSEYFKKLDAYLAKPTTASLKEVLDEAYQNMQTQNPIWGIPLIRFPGSNSFFRAIDIDNNIAIITATGLKVFQLQHTLKVAEISPLEIKGKEIVLLYPALISVPVKIIAPKASMGLFEVTIVSMIPGNACHIFNSLIVPNLSLESLLLSLHSQTRVKKAFLIKKLTTNNGIFENILFLIKPDRMMPTKTANSIIAKVISSEKFKNYENNYFFANSFSFGPWNIEKINDIGKIIQEYQSKINEAMPTAEALYHSTGGQQTREMLELEIKEFLKVLGDEVLPTAPTHAPVILPSAPTHEPKL